MPDDLLPFLAGIAVLVLYLCWSAATEMGTRWPKRRSPHPGDSESQ